MVKNKKCNICDIRKSEISCKRCFFCTSNVAHKCHYDKEERSIPAHNYCGNFIDRISGCSIQDMLKCQKNKHINSQYPENVKDEISKKIDDFKRK